MIKIEHTLFALPFAFLGAFLGAGGFPSPTQCFWITLAMVGARSAAMTFNRLADHSIDAVNPRTRDRALPARRLSRRFALLFTLLSSALLLLASYHLNRLALALSPAALLIVFFYSYTKRFTWLSHLFLGLALSCAPIGGWIAVRGTFEPGMLLFGAVVALWIAGGDIFYACMDHDFDCGHGLYSIPARWGIKRALHIAAFFHLMMMILLAFAFLYFHLKGIAWTGYVIVLLLLVVEHRLVNPQDLRRVNTAFFTMNAVISLILFFSVCLDRLLHPLRMS